MTKKIFTAALILLSSFGLMGQINWEKLDLLDQSNKKILINQCYSISRATDTSAIIMYVPNSIAPLRGKLAIFSMIDGKTITMLDTNTIQPIRTIIIKNKLYQSSGLSIKAFNFNTTLWDSIANVGTYNDGFNQKRNGFIKIDDDSILLIGSKIAKLCVNNNDVKIVSDSSYFNGGCISSTKYFALYKRPSSPSNIDSSYLVISKDRGEHWDTRIRLAGNYDDNPRMFFVNKDTGYIGYTSKLKGSKLEYYMLRTKDGGVTWPDTIKYFMQQVGVVNGGVKEIYFLNKDIGFVSFGSSIFKTIDGGNVWYETMGQYTDGLSMFFVNDSVGYAGVGKYFPSFELCIFKTTNQGGPPYKTIDHSGVKKTEAELVKINIHPNPNNGTFTVETPNLSIIGIKVYDNNSKLVFSETYSGELNTQQIQLQNVTSGVYYVHITTKEIHAVMSKIIVH